MFDGSPPAGNYADTDLAAVPVLGAIDTFNYNAAAMGTMGPADWQPVPEPGTLALFGLGMLVMVVRKRLRG